jgi:hypothetical protein
LDNTSLSLEKVRLNFLDIIFGVIIAASFTDSKDLLVPLSFSFQTLTLLLAYLVVFGAWISYHYSFARSASDKVTFIPTNIVVGLVQLYLYFYLLESVKNFSAVVIILPVIIAFDIIGTTISTLTTSSIRRESRRLVLVYGPILRMIGLAIFITQAIVYNSLVGHSQSPILGGAPLFDWYILTVSFLTYIVLILLNPIMYFIKGNPTEESNSLD